MARLILFFLVPICALAVTKVKTEIEVKQAIVIDGLIRYLTKAELRQKDLLSKDDGHYFETQRITCYTGASQTRFPSCFFNGEAEPRLIGGDARYFITYLQAAGAYSTQNIVMMYDLSCFEKTAAESARCSYTVYK